VCTISKDELDFSDGDVAVEPADDSHGFSLVFAITCIVIYNGVFIIIATLRLLGCILDDRLLLVL
jgi:hypothetical protein